MEFIVDVDTSLNDITGQPNANKNIVIDNNALYKKLLQIENEIHHIRTAVNNINYIHCPYPVRPYLYAPLPQPSTWYNVPFRHSFENNN